MPRGYWVSHLQKFGDLGHNALVLRGATFAALQLAGGFETRPHHVTVCSEKNGVWIELPRGSLVEPWSHVPGTALEVFAKLIILTFQQISRTMFRWMWTLFVRGGRTVSHSGHCNWIVPQPVAETWHLIHRTPKVNVDKKNQLDTTFVFFISLLLVANHPPAPPSN